MLKNPTNEKVQRASSKLYQPTLTGDRPSKVWLTGQHFFRLVK